MRAIAKQVGAMPGDVGLLLTLAIELRLVDTTVAARRGRGRSQQVDLVWGPSATWDGFAAHDAATRWRTLVQAWFDAKYLQPGAELPERFDRPDVHPRTIVQRIAFCQYLTSLPVGTGVDETELGLALHSRSVAFYAIEEAASLVAAARVLGLVTTGDLVGLTSAGRAMLTGEVADGASAAAVRSFIVQADHTVVVPPDLAGEVEERLESFAELESSGGARVYRITERSVAAALDLGDTGGGIEELLALHSSVAVPPNVVRTISDTAARHGVLRVGSSASWVVTDDPVALAGAVKVKAAKLFQLNATTAVSALSESELTSVLRHKGLSPTSDAELSARLMSHTAKPSKINVRDALLTPFEDLAERASQLLTAPIPPRPEPPLTAYQRAMAAHRATLEQVMMHAEMDVPFDD